MSTINRWLVLAGKLVDMENSMVYLINHRVLFSTMEYQLSLLDDNTQVIRLSNTAGRVLEELIIVHGDGTTVTRETLFAHVWELHGLQPSNGNLNQQISIIRKALISLGLDTSAIVTLPKRGLKLNDQLVITAERATETAIDAAGGAMRVQDTLPILPTNLSAIMSFTRTMMSSPILINWLLGIAVAGTILLTFSYFSTSQKQSLFFFHKIDTCNVYTLRPFNEREHPELSAFVSKAMAGNIQPCHENNVVVFSRTTVANPVIKQQINRRTFLAKCDKDTRGALTDCLNFYFYNWAGQ